MAKQIYGKPANNGGALELHGLIARHDSQVAAKPEQLVDIIAHCADVWRFLPHRQALHITVAAGKDQRKAKVSIMGRVDGELREDLGSEH